MSVAGWLDFPLNGLTASRKDPIPEVAGVAGVADCAAGAGGVDRSLGAGAGVGNGMVSALTAAAPASHPDSNTATHTPWRIPAMSLSAFVVFAALRFSPSGPT